MLNSSHIQRKIEQGPRLRRLMQMAKRNRRNLVGSLYLTILSRYPTPDELTTALNYFQADGVNSRQAAVDLAWALINTKEFLCRH